MCLPKFQINLLHLLSTFMLGTAHYFEMLAHLFHITCFLNPEIRNRVEKALITSKIMLCNIIPPFAWLKLYLCVIKLSITMWRHMVKCITPQICVPWLIQRQEVSFKHTAALLLERAPSTYWIGSRVDHRAGLDASVRNKNVYSHIRNRISSDM